MKALMWIKRPSDPFSDATDGELDEGSHLWHPTFEGCNMAARRPAILSLDISRILSALNMKKHWRSNFIWRIDGLQKEECKSDFPPGEFNTMSKQ